MTKIKYVPSICRLDLSSAFWVE